MKKNPYKTTIFPNRKIQRLRMIWSRGWDAAIHRKRLNNN
jgi:hypothetical protein